MMYSVLLQFRQTNNRQQLVVKTLKQVHLEGFLVYRRWWLESQFAKDVVMHSVLLRAFFHRSDLHARRVGLLFGRSEAHAQLTRALRVAHYSDDTKHG
eukprot:4274016-Amphidinium_carterae.1